MWIKERREDKRNREPLVTCPTLEELNKIQMLGQAKTWRSRDGQKVQIEDLEGFFARASEQSRLLLIIRSLHSGEAYFFLFQKRSCSFCSQRCWLKLWLGNLNEGVRKQEWGKEEKTGRRENPKSPVPQWKQWAILKCQVKPNPQEGGMERSKGCYI